MTGLSNFLGTVRSLARGKPIIPLFILAVTVLCGLFAPLIAPHSPTVGSLADSLEPPFWQSGGSAAHLLGTDYLGRDVLSRIIWGARVSLIVGLASILIAAAVGTVLGLIAGYFGGFVDTFIMRTTDVMLALPYILVAIVVADILGARLLNVIIIVAMSFWAPFARVVRAETISLKQRDFITLAVVGGLGRMAVMRRHLLPNVANSVIVLATLYLAGAILFEAALSFLGMGVPAPAASWGLMASEGKTYVTIAWWLVTLPGLAIAIVILAVNLVGDWLRDRLDPKLRQL